MLVRKTRKMTMICVEDIFSGRLITIIIAGERFAVLNLMQISVAVACCEACVLCMTGREGMGILFMWMNYLF